MGSSPTVREGVDQRRDTPSSRSGYCPVPPQSKEVIRVPNQSAVTAEQLSETDHVQLSRLVTEHAWKADNGRADTIHELYVG